MEISKKLPLRQVVKSYSKNRVARLDDLEKLNQDDGYKSFTTELSKTEINNLNSNPIVISIEDIELLDNNEYLLFKYKLDIDYDSGSSNFALPTTIDRIQVFMGSTPLLEERGALLNPLFSASNTGYLVSVRPSFTYNLKESNQDITISATDDITGGDSDSYMNITFYYKVVELD